MNITQITVTQLYIQISDNPLLIQKTTTQNHLTISSEHKFERAKIDKKLSI